MLRQIMKEVAEDARTSNRDASDAYFAKMRRDIAVQQLEWADRINSIVNGR